MESSSLPCPGLRTKPRAEGIAAIPPSIRSSRPTVCRCDANASRTIRRGRAAAQTRVTVRTDSSAMDNSPGAPSGHGSEAPGIAAVYLATAAIQAL